jgi:hypothetical protein
MSKTSKSNFTAKAAAPKPPSPVTFAVRIQPHQRLKLCLVLDDGSKVGRVLCTILADSEGLEYRRANQKKPGDRKLRWDMLDRIMQLGLL